MASLPLLLVQGRNCHIQYAGDTSLNCQLALGKVKLPVAKETYEDFQPGATNGSMEIATGAEACVLGFDLKGLSPEVMALTQIPRGDRIKITVFAALVNEYAETGGNREIPVTATAYGRINAEMGELEPNMGTDYEVKSISKYSLIIGNREICRWNVQLGGWQAIGGQTTRINQMIGVV